jgi:hypothetical protein
VSDNTTPAHTRWYVTDLTPGTLVTVVSDSYIQLHVSLEEDVSSTYPTVYVAVYAVTWWDYLDYNPFYAISDLSNTYEARPATIVAPVLSPVDYLVYQSGQVQTMVLTWTAPTSASIPGFTVSSYTVRYSTNGGSSWTETNVGLVLTYNFDCSNRTTYPCGTELQFEVYATVTGGGDSPNSNMESQNIFYYSTAPADLTLAWAVYDSGSDNMTFAVQWSAPTDTGCGAPVIYQWSVLDGSTTVDSGTTTLTPTPLDETIIVPWPGTSTYSFEVYLQTTDTNAPFSTTMNGATATITNITPQEVPFITNINGGGLAGNCLDPTPSATFTFDVYTRLVLLKPVGVFIYVNGSGDLISDTWDTTAYDSRTLSDDVYKYSFTRPVPTFSSYFAIACSNDAGIGTYTNLAYCID